jgi:flagellin
MNDQAPAVKFDASRAAALREELAALELAEKAEKTARIATLTESIAAADTAIVSVNAIRANFGAMQNRLQSTVNNIGVSDENLSAANSRVRDADIAAETSEMARNNILLQAGVSVLTQANAVQQVALKLLG